MKKESKRKKTSIKAVDPTPEKITKDPIVQKVTPLASAMINDMDLLEKYLLIISQSKF